MSILFNKCKECVDSEYRDWEKTRLAAKDKKMVQEGMAYGIVKLALYILNFKEYMEFKQYIYDKYGYDPGGVQTKQYSLEELQVMEDEEHD